MVACHDAYNAPMDLRYTTIRAARQALAERTTSPAELAGTALEHANRNCGRNTYLWRDPAWTIREAARAAAMDRASGGSFGDGRSNLWGIPVSVKDCFDLAGATGQAYSPLQSDVGATLRVVVTASNSVGSAAASSVDTGVVQAAPSPPLNTSSPTM